MHLKFQQVCSYNPFIMLLVSVTISLIILFQVQITHRIAWRRNRAEGGSCTLATIDAQTLLPSGGYLTCQRGCSGNIGNFSYYCTDFSVTDNWSAGERTYTYTFSGPSFEARSCCTLHDCSKITCSDN